MKRLTWVFENLAEGRSIGYGRATVGESRLNVMRLDSYGLKGNLIELSTTGSSANNNFNNIG
jgi:hypothetical protein